MAKSNRRSRPRPIEATYTFKRGKVHHIARVNRATTPVKALQQALKHLLMGDYSPSRSVTITHAHTQLVYASCHMERGKLFVDSRGLF